MIKTHNNPPNYFKELDTEVLEAFCKTVVNKFDEVPFEKISLFRYSHPLFNTPEYADWFRYKYAIVFEIRNYKGLSDLPQYKEFKKAIDYWSDVKRFILLGADNYFPNVYKKEPVKDCNNEWIFFLKTIDEEMPIGVLEDDMHWILFSRKQGKEIPENKTRPEAIKPFLCEAGTKIDLPAVIESDKPDLQKHANVFCFCGNNWYVKCNGKSDTIKDSKGMRYIAFLLDSPSKFSSLDLERLVCGNQSEYNKDYSEMSPKQLEKEGLSQDELYFGGMTQEDKEKLKDAAWEVWERAKSKNQKDVEAWEDCKNHLDRKYGCIPCEKNNELKFIFKKRFKTEANRVRLRVSKNIETAIAKIKASNFELAEHLSNKANLHTGNVLWYKRDPDIDWFIQK